MKHLKALLLGLLFIASGTGILSAAETDIKGSADHPLVPRVPGFYISAYSHVELGMGKFIGQTKKSSTIEGRKTTIEYRLVKDLPIPGELKIRRTLQENAKLSGGKVLYDDNFNRCTTLYFQDESLEAWVDVRANDKIYRLTIIDKEPDKHAILSTPGRMPVVMVNWPKWIESAKKGVRTGMPQWVSKAKLKDCVVNSAICTGGKLDAPALFPLLASPMTQDGVPENIINGIMGPLYDAVMAWAASTNVPGLPWYPSFENVYGEYATPQPSPQTQLGALILNREPLVPATLSNAIRTRLGNAAASQDVRSEIDNFCTWFHDGFSAWLTTAPATITGVWGEGPVATKYFDPMAGINSGPVANGKANGGIISPLPSWP